MTPGEAFAQARAAILAARKAGAARLSLRGGAGFAALTTLPPEIAGLAALRDLDLSFTALTSAQPLAGLTGLTHLSLPGTVIRDAAPLAGLSSLRVLHLSGLPLEDLSFLASLPGLEVLNLSAIPARDFAPLARLHRLTILDLGGTVFAGTSVLQGMQALSRLVLTRTAISDQDLAPLAALPHLANLDLCETGIADLSPLVALRACLQPGPAPYDGLHFAGTLAAQRDPEIARIARVEDNADRARQLFRHLGGVAP